jgi:hypothetical protein
VFGGCSRIQRSNAPILNKEWRLADGGIDQFSVDTDELAKHVAQNFLTLKIVGDENTVITPIYKLRDACHRVI